MSVATQFNISHNEAKTLALILRFTGTFNPIDLTNATEIVVKFPMPANQYLVKKLSLTQVQIDPSSPKIGRILIPLAGADSVQFNVGLGQDIEVDITGIVGTGLVTVARCPKILNVYKQVDEA